MNQRFAILTFAGCTVMFAGVWAMSAPIPKLAGTPTDSVASAVMYADCDAVRAANAAPLRASQPGYRPALDPNMNGIACESVGAPDAGFANAPPPSDPAADTQVAVPDAPVPVPVPQQPADPQPVEERLTPLT